jgi:hypothetical protein
VIENIDKRDGLRKVFVDCGVAVVIPLSVNQ